MFKLLSVEPNPRTSFTSCQRVDLRSYFAGSMVVRSKFMIEVLRLTVLFGVTASRSAAQPRARINGVEIVRLGDECTGLLVWIGRRLRAVVSDDGPELVAKEARKFV